jgi:hypothetical protein
VSKNKLGFFAVLIAVVLLYALAWMTIWPAPAADPHQKLLVRLSRIRTICAVVCDFDQLKTWLGRDYGVLIDIGTGSKGVYEILALPEDKERALRRIQSLAREHGLRLIY